MKKIITTIGAGLAAIAALVLLAACPGQPAKPNAQDNGQAQTQSAYAKQAARNPYPFACDKTNPFCANPNYDGYSQELQNIGQKLLRYNNPSKISYLYLLTNTGGIYAYFTIKGKVSSNSSQMTTTDLIQPCSKHGDSGGGNCAVTVAAPGDDGSYGPNERGEFAFTTDNVMITWSTDYILTDAPLKIEAPTTSLSYVQGSKPTSTGGK